MTERLSIDDAQLQKIFAAIDAFKDHTPYWRHVLIVAAPVFLAAVLGVGVGFFTDWLKTRRENRRISCERREKELAQLNVAATAMGYNIEALLHIVMQQVLPHHDQSHSASTALRAAGNNVAQLRAFAASMSSVFPAMMTRCPEPHFVDVDFFKEIPFVLEKDPELLKLSGWVVNYTRSLKEILRERNKQNEAKSAVDMDLQELEEKIRVQAHIGNVEVLNSLMIFEQFLAICKRLEKIMVNYKGIVGPHLKVLKVVHPAPLDGTLRGLRRIAAAVAPEYQPPQADESERNH
jgi:hypothetical protein